MDSFQIIREALTQTNLLEHYETSFIRKEIDDETVSQCLTDKVLSEQLKDVIPKVPHFVKFCSKFKEIQEKGDFTGDSDNSNTNVVHDAQKVGVKEDIGQSEEIISTNTTIVIPLPPPLPPPQPTQTLLKEMIEKTLKLKSQDCENSAAGSTSEIEASKPNSGGDDMTQKSAEGQSRIKGKEITKAEIKYMSELNAKIKDRSAIDIDAIMKIQKETANSQSSNDSFPELSKSLKSGRCTQGSGHIIEDSNGNELQRRLQRRNSINAGLIQPQVRILSLINDGENSDIPPDMTGFFTLRKNSPNKKRPGESNQNSGKPINLCELEGKLTRRKSMIEGMFLPQDGKENPGSGSEPITRPTPPIKPKKPMPRGPRPKLPLKPVQKLQSEPIVEAEPEIPDSKENVEAKANPEAKSSTPLVVLPPEELKNVEEIAEFTPIIPTPPPLPEYQIEGNVILHLPVAKKASKVEVDDNQLRDQLMAAIRKGVELRQVDHSSDKDGSRDVRVNDAQLQNILRVLIQQRRQDMESSEESDSDYSSDWEE